MNELTSMSVFLVRKFREKVDDRSEIENLQSLLKFYRSNCFLRILLISFERKRKN